MIESVVEYSPGQYTSGAITALADLNTIDTRGYSRLFMTLLNGAAALTAFVVQARAIRDQDAVTSASYATLASVTGDYTTPSGVIAKASGDLTVLANAAVGYLILDVRGIESVKFRASCGTSTTLVLSWGMS